MNLLAGLTIFMWSHRIWGEEAPLSIFWHNCEFNTRTYRLRLIFRISIYTIYKIRKQFLIELIYMENVWKMSGRLNNNKSKAVRITLEYQPFRPPTTIEINEAQLVRTFTALQHFGASFRWLLVARLVAGFYALVSRLAFTRRSHSGHSLVSGVFLFARRAASSERGGLSIRWRRSLERDVSLVDG